MVANLTRYIGAFNEYPNCDCCILQDSNGEYVKFDEAVEASSNSLQHLKAKIRAISDIIEVSESGLVTVDFARLKQRLRELSAV